MSARIVHTLFGIVLLGVLAASASGATMDNQRATYITFSRAVQMPGVQLPAGTYIFEVVNPNSTSDLVRVLSRDRSKVFLKQFTRFVHRPFAATLTPSIALGEAVDGNPPPVKAWYPDTETLGREFIY